MARCQFIIRKLETEVELQSTQFDHPKAQPAQRFLKLEMRIVRPAKPSCLLLRPFELSAVKRLESSGRTPVDGSRVIPILIGSCANLVVTSGLIDTKSPIDLVASSRSGSFAFYGPRIRERVFGKLNQGPCSE